MGRCSVSELLALLGGGFVVAFGPECFEELGSGTGDSGSNGADLGIADGRGFGVLIAEQLSENECGSAIGIKHSEEFFDTGGIWRKVSIRTGVTLSFLETATVPVVRAHYVDAGAPRYCEQPRFHVVDGAGLGEAAPRAQVGLLYRILGSVGTYKVSSEAPHVGKGPPDQEVRGLSVAGGCGFDQRTEVHGVTIG